MGHIHAGLVEQKYVAFWIGTQILSTIPHYGKLGVCRAPKAHGKEGKTHSKGFAVRFPGNARQRARQRRENARQRLFAVRFILHARKKIFVVRQM
jgi:hypothetical protein